jgi:ADP-heptose:LPS heptosyltransferase
MLPIGDTIWLAPTTRALRARYPAASISALAYPSNAPVAALLPGVDEVTQFDPRRDLAQAYTLARLLANLRGRRYDWAITFTSPAFKWISLLSGIPQRTYMKFDRLWWLTPRGTTAGAPRTRPSTITTPPASWIFLPGAA